MSEPLNSVEREDYERLKRIVYPVWIGFSGCKIEYRLVQKIKVVGPMGNGKEVLDSLHNDDWAVTRSGPYTDKKLFPKTDPERFLYHAEKEVEIEK